MLKSEVHLARVTLGHDFFPPVLYFFPVRRRTRLDRTGDRPAPGHGDQPGSVRPALILFFDTEDRPAAGPGVPQTERRRHRQPQYSWLSRVLFWVQRWRFSTPDSSVLYR